MRCSLATSKRLGTTDVSRINFDAKAVLYRRTDLWIAATAWQHGLTLVSRDLHFKEVEKLPIKKW